MKCSFPILMQDSSMPAIPAFVLASLLGLLISPLTRGQAAERPPNLVLILADDLGYETVGCYGGQSYATPHLDRLAAEGMRFERAYAMPLCTNTRIQLMTGKYNLRNWQAFGILDPAATTFGHVLQQAGYRTCIAGKWQLTSYDPLDYPGGPGRRNTGMRVADSGFDTYSLWHTGHTENKGSRYADPIIEENGKLLADTQGKYGPDLWTDFIGEFMEHHRDEPFFVYYSMALPHNPMNPTPDSPEWQDVDRRHADETPFAHDMIEYTDKMVGKVVAKVDELGLRENTLILFFSDNGTNYRVQSQFRNKLVGGEKGKGTELGIRVPLIARWPGRIAANQVTSALVDSVDFLPTLASVGQCGNDLPKDLDGRSFLPILEGQAESSRDYVYVHQDPRPGWDKDRFSLIRLALGTQGFKLYEDGRLFNVNDDFFEEHPSWPTDDNNAQRRARNRLQQVLDSFEPFERFDPRTVPREDPHAVFERYAFQMQLGGRLVVVEAEQIPFGRDESWSMENSTPGYTGLGYLRALRSESSSAKNQPQLGTAKVQMIVESQGTYRTAFRLRCDRGGQPDSQTLRFKASPEQNEWAEVALGSAQATGKWHWVEGPTIELKERSNVILIAPGSTNLKLDRIVVFREDCTEQAHSLAAPASAFHPWASP